MRNNFWKILIVVGLLPLTGFAAREAKVRSEDTDRKSTRLNSSH